MSGARPWAGLSHMEIWASELSYSKSLVSKNRSILAQHENLEMSVSRTKFHMLLPCGLVESGMKPAKSLHARERRACNKCQLVRSELWRAYDPRSDRDRLLGLNLHGGHIAERPIRVRLRAQSSDRVGERYGKMSDVRRLEKPAHTKGDAAIFTIGDNLEQRANFLVRRFVFA